MSSSKMAERLCFLEPQGHHLQSKGSTDFVVYGGAAGHTDDGFQERYLKLKKEEIDRFAAIEEKKLEDPYNINKCITVLEGLNGLQLGDMLMASDIFKCKENREVFLSYSNSELRLAWLKREIARGQANQQN